MLTRSKAVIVGLFTSVMLLNVGVLAQSSSMVEGLPPPANENDPNLLAGPQVEKEAATGEGNAMGAGGAQRRRAETIPLRQWMQQVRDLEGLTTQQQQDIALIFSEFQAAQREYQQAHADEMRALQQKISQAREASREPEANLREQMQKLEGGMPKPPDYQRRIWAVLTAEQQAALRQRIAEMERRMLERRRNDQAARNAGVSDEEMMTGDKSAEADAKLGAGQTRGEAGKMTSDAAGEDRPNARERLRERRRAAGGGDDLAGLDDLARQRVEFLRQHISTSSPARAGDAPLPAERTFKFEEEGASGG